MPDEKSFHMTPDEFRRHGHAVVDWIADYSARIESFPVLSQVKPGEIRASLPPTAPAHGEPSKRMLTDVEKLILPGITHWQSPNFFAYFPCNASGPAILGDLLSSGLGVQGMLWSTSPACTELETHVLDWLVPMLGLPEKFLSSGTGGGVIQDTASSAALCALLAGRERATELRQQSERMRRASSSPTAPPRRIPPSKKPPRSPASEPQNLRAHRSRREFRHAPRRSRPADRGGQARRPAFPVSSAPRSAPLPRMRWIPSPKSPASAASTISGCTSTPPCPAPRRSAPNSATCTTESNSPTATASTRTSGCSPTSIATVFWVADRKALIQTLSVLPEYLRNQATESGAVIDYRDWHIPLGRRFRSLKLWFVIRHYGVEGLQHHIREHVRTGAGVRRMGDARTIASNWPRRRR